MRKSVTRKRAHLMRLGNAIIAVLFVITLYLAKLWAEVEIDKCWAEPGAIECEDIGLMVVVVGMFFVAGWVAYNVIVILWRLATVVIDRANLTDRE